eukprot:1511820-Prymnesium_polylepis.1
MPSSLAQRDIPWSSRLMGQPFLQAHMGRLHSLVATRLTTRTRRVARSTRLGCQHSDVCTPRAGLKAAGFCAGQLKAAAFGAEALKTAGYEMLERKL